MNSTRQVSKSMQAGYDEFYTDELTEWRELGGKYKARHVMEVCAGHNFAKVMECGAGEGSILKFLDEFGVFGELYALEISDSGISQILKRKIKQLKEVKKFDGYEIPYPNKEFDMVYCSHVIEHVEHPRLLLREIKRVSHFQVFEIPLDYSYLVDSKVDYFLSFGHINIYTPALFKFLIRSEGYKIIADLYTHSEPDICRYGWHKNLKHPNINSQEIRLKLRPILNMLRKFKYGRRYKEYIYNAYTCLAEGTGDLKIF